MGQVYLYDRSDRPEWVTVSTALFGNNESFIPLRDATLSGDGRRARTRAPQPMTR